MVLSTWWGWSNTGNVALSVSLAFVFGYSLTMLPLLRARLTLRRSLALAFASDTLSIATMEVLDTLIIFILPGAMNAGVGDPLFWGSLAGALFVAFWAALAGEQSADLVCLEGNLRLTGHALAGFPVGVECLIGTAPTMARWAQ